MSEKNQTITGGLGLDEGYFETARESVKNKLEALNTISEALEAVAEDLRNEELGEVDFDVSDYEKKLILSGFIMGCVRSETHMAEKLEELKFMMHLMAMSKQVGTGEDGSAILGGMLNAADLPKELRDILEKIIKEKGEDD